MFKDFEDFFFKTFACIGLVFALIIVAAFTKLCFFTH